MEATSCEKPKCILYKMVARSTYRILYICLYMELRNISSRIMFFALWLKTTNANNILFRRITQLKHNIVGITLD